MAFLHSEVVSTRPASLLLFADAVSNEIARHRELGRQIEIKVDENVVAGQVAISPGNLQRLLDNLIDNAFQYGAPPVEVALYSKQTGFITLEICDHGPGIAAEQRNRALEAFVQIDPSRATGGSCGLGLAIVKRIVA
ncbi:MAG: ATP-binding protein, partial [Betaproteobacteria bacterium]